MIGDVPERGHRRQTVRGFPEKRYRGEVLVVGHGLGNEVGRVETFALDLELRLCPGPVPGASPVFLEVEESDQNHECQEPKRNRSAPAFRPGVESLAR